MYKHYGNLISWGSIVITITTLILVNANILSIGFILLAIVVASIMDLFDGRVARQFISQKKDFIFGEFTDSLCDTINFGILPVYTFSYFFLNLNSLSLIVTILFANVFLWSVVFRLARFSRDKDSLKVEFYYGLPVTIAGPFSVLVTFLFQQNIFLAFLFNLLLISLMLSTLKFKKL